MYASLLRRDFALRTRNLIAEAIHDKRAQLRSSRIVQPEHVQVTQDRRLDALHPDEHLRAATRILLASETVEVRVDAAVTLGMHYAQAASTAAAVERPLERVRMLTRFVTRQAAAGK